MSSASDRQGAKVKSCVCMAVSPHSSHHQQEVLLNQFSLYVNKDGLKPHSFTWVDTHIAFSRISRYHAYRVITHIGLSRISRYHAYRVIMHMAFSRISRCHAYRVITHIALSRISRYHTYHVITHITLSHISRYQMA